jgi:rod shape-determining protein MreC
MDSLFKFLKRIHFLLIFLILEVISIVNLVKGDVRKNSVFHTSANYVVGSLYNFAWKYVGYFNLREENKILTEKLSEIKAGSENSYIMDTAKFHDHRDISGILKYKYITASVIKNSVSRQNNFLTLDVGSDHGVKADMGVISASGVVGVVVATSKHFSLVISMLNKKISISAKLKKTNFYGSIIWPGEDYRYAIFTEIPNHVDIAAGDTVETSGYSAIFPPGLPVATIETFEKNSDDNFYTIKVKLLTDLKHISNVFVIENLMQEEQLELETQESKFVQ